MHKIIYLLCLLLIACDDTSQQELTQNEAISLENLEIPTIKRNNNEIDWLDLLPKEDLKALEEMPEIEHLGAENAVDWSKSMKSKGLPDVMYSTRVVNEFNNQDIKIGGFPVPLELDESGWTTKMFLVPYAGACIHTPAPPPNQIIFIEYEKAIKISDIYLPIWVYGKLEVKQLENAVANSSYYIKADNIQWVKVSEM